MTIGSGNTSRRPINSGDVVTSALKPLSKNIKYKDKIKLRVRRDIKVPKIRSLLTVKRKESLKLGHKHQLAPVHTMFN